MSTVGEYFAGLLLRGIDEDIDGEGVVQSFQGTPADGSYELPTGPPGEPGVPGVAAHRFRWEGDISDQVALSALATGLGPAHAGQAWRVLSTNALMIWTGKTFESYPDAFGGRGPDGEPNVLTRGTVTTGAAGADLEIEITGTAPAQTVNLVVPRGVQGLDGPLGPPGPLRQADDYDNTPPHINGMVPLWDDVAEKWHPTPYPGWRGPWSILETQAWDGGGGFAASQANVGTTPNTIATLSIPAQDTAWRPFVTGAVLVRTGSSQTDNATRIDLEARLGSAAGQVVGFGGGIGYGLDWPLQLVPYFATSAMTPASSVGVVAAGAAATIVLVLRRNLGSGNYTYQRTGAHVAVWAVPTTGAPA